MAKLALTVVAGVLNLAAAGAGGNASGLASAALAGTNALDFLNNAGGGITLMRGCDNWGHFAPGEGKTLQFPPGPNKLWIRPDGCEQPDGCYPCNLDCLGCFYISTDVDPSDTMVTGIGFGHNAPVKVQFNVASATFEATNSTGQAESVSCSASSCDFNHIIQARAGTGKLTIGYDASAAVVV
uniref:Uncharacterized protein n=1 Tax=Alexandrium andersonii TaxID=327968 RepID=A0A7S2NBW5_9DINO